MNIGRCYFHTNRFKNATKWFELGIKCDPKYPDSYYCLAASLLKLGEFETARATIRKIDILGGTHEEDPFATNKRASRTSTRSMATAKGSSNVSRTNIGVHRNVFDEFKAELVENLRKSEYYSVE